MEEVGDELDENGLKEKSPENWVSVTDSVPGRPICGPVDRWHWKPGNSSLN